VFVESMINSSKIPDVRFVKERFYFYSSYWKLLWYLTFLDVLIQSYFFLNSLDLTVSDLYRMYISSIV
jgi:hypothetical protein